MTRLLGSPLGDLGGFSGAPGGYPTSAVASYPRVTIHSCAPRGGGGRGAKPLSNSYRLLSIALRDLNCQGKGNIKDKTVIAFFYIIHTFLINTTINITCPTSSDCLWELYIAVRLAHWAIIVFPACYNRTRPSGFRI